MHKKYLYFLGAAHLCCDINTGALPALLPFFVIYYSLNYEAAAGLIFASCFLATLVQPLFGYFADQASRSYFMGLGVLISGLSLASTGLLHSYWPIFAAITCMGIGSSIFHPETARLANFISGTSKGMGMSIFSVGGNAGFGLGPLLGVALVTSFGMKGILFFGLIAIVMSALLFYFAPQIKAAAREMNDVPEKGADEEKSHSFSSVEKLKNDWKSFGKLSLIIICRSVTFCALQSFLPLYCIHVLKSSPAVGSTTLTVFSFLGVVMTLWGGFLADRFGCVRVIRILMAILVFFWSLLSFAKSVVFVYVLLLPISFAMFGSYSAYVVLGQTYLSKSVGFASGITLGVAFSIGGMIVPFMGNFADHYGLLSVFQLNILITLVGLLGSFLLHEPPKRTKVN